MNSKDFFKALDALCEERGLNKEDILQVMQKGLLNAFKKEYGTTNAIVEFNEAKSEIQVYEVFYVVNDDEVSSEMPGSISVLDAKRRGLKANPKVGDVIKEPRSPKNFGRLAANSSKQILTQELKRLEREKTYELFKSKEDEMISAVISAVNNDFVTFTLDDNLQATLPVKELSEDEVFVGNRVMVYLSKVEMTTKGPKAFISRTDKNLIKRLFETYVPEIKEGVVEIYGLARDTGDRTKICVMTNNPDVDPIGACLGPKGLRVKEINNALNGEKIDIYEYSDNPKELVANALKPAEVLTVNINQKEKSAVAIVPNDQLSLAIGKKGQNARLAVQSSGWKIDIKSLEQANEEGIEY